MIDVLAKAAPLKLGVKLGYSAGQLVEGVFNNALSVFLLFYVTTACGLSGGLAGIALSAGILVDAVMDPLIGSLSDRWRSRFGRRLPFMVVGLVPLTICFLLIFALPSGLSQIGLAVWLAVLSIVMRISMSMFVLPYQAVGAELSDDYAERSSLMTWRWGIGQLGALIVIVLGLGVFLGGKNGLTHRAAYIPFGVCLAAVLVAGALVAIRTTWVMRARLHPPQASEGGIGVSLVREMAEVFRNPSFRILFFGALLFFVSIGVYSALSLHTNTFFWKLSAGQTQVVTLALFGGLLLGAPLAGPLLKWFEKATILTAGMLGLGLAQAVPVLLRFAGLLPLTGDGLVVVIATIMLAGGSLMAAAAIAFLAMLADAADEHELLFGARREGLFFAGWAFSSKAAGGIGALVAGWVLQLIHFPTDLAKHPELAVGLPQHMTDTLAWFTGPGTGLLAILAALINLGYRLDGKAHAAILLDLQARRSASSSAAAQDPTLPPAK